TAFGLIPAPSARDLLERVPRPRVDVAGTDDLTLEAGARQPVNGLPHLANRSALQREAGRLDHRLVSVVERLQAVAAVEVEAPLRDAEDRDAPVAAASMPDEARDEVVERALSADRIARDDRDAVHDAIGEERALVLVEEVRLVGPEHERRERVDA